MKLKRTNGDLIDLSVSEYKELITADTKKSTKNREENNTARKPKKGLTSMNIENKALSITEFLRKNSNKKHEWPNLCEQFEIIQWYHRKEIINVLKKNKDISVGRKGGSRGNLYILKYKKNNENDGRKIRGEFIGNKSAELMEKGYTRKDAWKKASEMWRNENVKKE